MSFSVIIPARFGSSRLPGKVLVDIAGRPMIQHVYERAVQSQANKVLIATDDQRVACVAKGFGADVCMTTVHHPSGTDRLQEVAKQRAFGSDDVVINVQGDQPLVSPLAINQLAANLINTPWNRMSTLMEKLPDKDAVFNPRFVKVAVAEKGRAVYFSRGPIPWARDAFSDDQRDLPEGMTYYRHIGLYAYRVSLLHEFVQWSPGVLEKIEKLEQLRVLENGEAIHIEEAVESVPSGVNTEEDLEQTRALFMRLREEVEITEA